MNRNLIIAANWKMYKTAREATDYIEHFAPKIEGCKSKILIAMPFTAIASVASYAKEAGIVIGAQNMNDAREGAFTGEISALMLKEAGAGFVILGHSERRRIFGETDEMIHRKVLRALQDDLQPVVCIGETSGEHESGKTRDVLKRQIETALADVPEKEANRLIIAYEPVWAIGTQQTAAPEHAQEVHAYCRKILETLFGKRIASGIPIIYGGSVNSDNVGKLVSQKDIDGVLVGGASLDPDVLSAIVLKCEGIR